MSTIDVVKLDVEHFARVNVICNQRFCSNHQKGFALNVVLNLICLVDHHAYIVLCHVRMVMFSHMKQI